jgi:hypothetical protein
MSGFSLLLRGKQTFGELPQNDAHDPKPTLGSPLLLHKLAHRDPFHRWHFPAVIGQV